MYRLARTSLLAAMLLVAAPAAAQQSPSEPLQAREIAAAGARDAWELMEKLRPGWLNAAGDPATPQAQTRTLVFVDGRHVGDLRLLRGLATRNIAQVRHLDERGFLESKLPTMDTDVKSVFLITSRRASRSATNDGSRVMLTVGAAPAPRAMGQLRDHLVASGYDRPLPAPVGSFTSREMDDGGPVFTGALRYLVTPRLSVEAGVQNSSPAWAGGYDGIRGSVLSRSSFTEVYALASVGTAFARVGAGPALRRTSWLWGRGSCACAEEQRSATMDPGAAGQVAVTLPARSRVFVELRGDGRWYGGAQVPGYTYSYTGGGSEIYEIPAADREAFSWSGALLVGVRL